MSEKKMKNYNSVTHFNSKISLFYIPTVQNSDDMVAKQPGLNSNLGTIVMTGNLLYFILIP